MSQRKADVKEIIQIREQLRQSSPGDDLPYDSRWARDFLGGAATAAPEVLREEVVIALVEELVDRGEAEPLSALAQSANKAAAKVARKGLHRLRTRKVQVQLPPPAPPTTSGTGQVGRSGVRGVISMYDHRMHRSVWLPHEAPRGLMLNRAKISAESGLLDFEVWASSRKKFREMRRAAREHIEVAEVEPEVVRWLIHDAARLAQRHQRGLPREYIKSSQLLGQVPDIPHPAEGIPPAAAPPAELNTILQLKALSLWVPEQEFMQRVALRVQEITTSRIIVDDRQRQAQLATLLEQVTEEYFTPARMEACRRVLLDTAHLLLAAERPQDAALVKAGALLFEGSPAEVHAHPLPRRFLERVLGGLAQHAEEAPPEEPASKLIIPG